MTKQEGVHYNIASYIHVDERTSKLQKKEAFKKDKYTTQNQIMASWSYNTLQANVDRPGSIREKGRYKAGRGRESKKN